jgi:membrane-associated phospholipid phosphatase
MVLIKTVIAVLLFFNAVSNVKSNSPYNIDNNVVAISNGFGLLAFGTGTALFLSLEDNNALQIRTLDPSDIPFFDRIALGKKSGSYSLASDILLYGLLSEAALINFRNPSELRPLESPWLPTFFTSTGLNVIAKTTARRARPYAYDTLSTDEKLASPDATLSFYSGHTSGAFTAGIYSAMMYEILEYPSNYRGYVWAGNLLAASATGILRIASGNHFPSDVFVGAIIGSVIGWGFPALYSRYTTGENSMAADITAFELSSMQNSMRIINIPIQF